MGYGTCLDCAQDASNSSCATGPNGLTCSGLGTCANGACVCRDCANGGDCARGNCDGESGVAGFQLASRITSVAEGTLSVALKLRRLLGATGERTISLALDDSASTAVSGHDYDPTIFSNAALKATFEDGQETTVVNVTLLGGGTNEHGDCRSLRVNLTKSSDLNVINKTSIDGLSEAATIYVYEPKAANSTCAALSPPAASSDALAAVRAQHELAGMARNPRDESISANAPSSLEEGSRRRRDSLRIIRGGATLGRQENQRRSKARGPTSRRSGNRRGSGSRER